MCIIVLTGIQLNLALQYDLVSLKSNLKSYVNFEACKGLGLSLFGFLHKMGWFANQIYISKSA